MVALAPTSARHYRPAPAAALPARGAAPPATLAIRVSATQPLPRPAVPPEAYDAHYFEQWCAGYETWNESDGARADPRYEWTLRRAGLAVGEVLVDIGCGRGELVALAVGEAGAARAVGVEYAPAAVEMARRTLAAHGADAKAEIVQADARAIPLPDAHADLVTLLDVVEHLTPAELDVSLAEARRILRPGGRLLVHTFPNRNLYRFTYRLQRLLRPARLRSWPADPRGDYERRMHVNEHTLGTLRRALRRARFAAVEVRLGDWIYTQFVPDERARGLYHRLAAHRLTAPLGLADLWATGERPAAGSAERSGEAAGPAERGR